MRTARLGGVIAAAAALLLFGAAPASAEQVTVTASGSGAEEVPPGQPGATVRGTFTIDTDTGSITYTVSVAGNNEPVAAAHIHEGPPGTPGGVVVPLDTAAVAAGTRTTTTVDPALAAEIAAAPENYYLNVHSASFPGGFARGQLRDAAPGSVSAGDGSSAADARALAGAVLLAAGAGAVVVGVTRRRSPAR